MFEKFARTITGRDFFKAFPQLAAELNRLNDNMELQAEKRETEAAIAGGESDEDIIAGFVLPSPDKVRVDPTEMQTGIDCWEKCPSYDGKRCDITGFRAPCYSQGGPCEVLATRMAVYLGLVDPDNLLRPHYLEDD